MRCLRWRVWLSGLVVVIVLFAMEVRGQENRVARNIVVPQARAFAVGGQVRVEITGVKVGVVILGQAATTTMEIGLKNRSSSRIESELIVPVPDGAIVRSFAFQGAESEPTAQVLAKEEARKIYDSIVAKIRDPALLEFVGYNLIRSSIFPVGANGTQKVRLTYEHILSADGDRIDYMLPRSESLAYGIPWQVSVKIKSKKPISTVYSPSHQISVTPLGKNAVSVQLTGAATTEPGPFMLSYLVARGGVTASLFTYPDPKVGGGYFLLLAGVPAKVLKEGEKPAIKREVTLVLDRSGSMRNEKLEQVREAALQILAGLQEGEAFNIIIYNDSVNLFSSRPVLKTKKNIETATAYLKSITASGGTNIYDALQEALRQKPTEGMLPIVLFLTDGLPTAGQTSEVAIRSLATDANPHKRRIFTFGVGVDVNTPLLQKIADKTRATATFVLPKEDVEVKVAQVFSHLTGPVLADAELEVLNKEKKPAPARVRDIIPDKLPDMFEGDQLVLLGQYIGNEPLTFRLSGNYLGRKRSFEFTFGLDKATIRNGFVPRLWASRKIGVLIDAIRQLGGNGSPATSHAAPVNPKVKELTDEIVRMSIEFGILTEYTAFLSRKGTDLSHRDAIIAEAQDNLERRAMRTRSGLGSVNQEMNNPRQMAQDNLNPDNAFLDENMNWVSITTVQQVNDIALFRRGERWVDSRLVENEKEVKPRRVIEFGTEEFRKLAMQLAKQQRQGSISLQGDILLLVDGEPVLVKGPTNK